jgi:hypothetical protein
MPVNMKKFLKFYHSMDTDFLSFHLTNHFSQARQAAQFYDVPLVHMAIMSMTIQTLRSSTR